MVANGANSCACVNNGASWKSSELAGFWKILAGKFLENSNLKHIQTPYLRDFDVKNFGLKNKMTLSFDLLSSNRLLRQHIIEIVVREKFLNVFLD